ncbi:MAG: tRNA pseudouridine(55) synthase TruB [Actinomycetota bacterium]
MLDGLLLVAKPTGVTSHDAVNTVRRTLGIKKVGHAGTLDPMASGLLIMGVGRGTRLLRFLADLKKEYEGTGKLGVETDTLDADGQVTRISEVDVSESDLTVAMKALTGEFEQTPPAFSAVQVGGERLYKAARRGEPVEAPPRPVRVDAFELQSYTPPDFDFRVVCSSGTYVRSLVADVGTSTGPGAHLTRLVRTRIGHFKLSSATKPDDIADPLPLEMAVAHLPRLDLTEDEAIAARHGRPLGPPDGPGFHAAVDPDGRLVGIYKDCGTKACPEVVIPA